MILEVLRSFQIEDDVEINIITETIVSHLICMSF